MDHSEAIRFLERHQPLPDDKNMSEDVISQYDDVRKWFLKHPDPKCIPLFLNSFGDGDGCGVYPLIEDVIARHSASDVVPCLCDAINSKSPSIRYWCAQIATRFPTKRLVAPLSSLLRDSDFGIRYMAIAALELIGGEDVKQILKDALKGESDEEIRELLQDAIKVS